jgi:hypothetical protein
LAQTEILGGLSVRHWGEIWNTPKAAESKSRVLLAAATKDQLAALKIRLENGEFYIPVRTLIILGRKN